ncbi:MAG TPA: hypothetical protein VMU27_01105 [Candidatus Paceibacterota bacterium]|nr:hypothetical protein [Candidatus Paceibacterota bacterium]
MLSENDAITEEWIKALPASSMVFPMTLRDRVKYFFWRLYTPFHPIVRDSYSYIFGSQSDSYPDGRQPFLLGKVEPGKLKELVDHLISKGFGNHFTAWEDRGQILSLRYVKDFKFQYHLRVFTDGEVRGHYEYTPECHPYLHMKMEGVPFEARREEFMAFLGSLIIPMERMD